MDPDESDGDRLSDRRRDILEAVGAAGFATIVAGCFSADGDESDGGDRSDGAATGGRGDTPDRSPTREDGDDGATDGATETADGAEPSDDTDDGEEDDGGRVPGFEIVDVDPAEVTADATYRGGFDITATIENTDDVAMTQTITLAVDGEDRASVSLELEAGASGTAAFEDVDAFGLAHDRSHAIDVRSIDDRATVPLAIADRPWSGTVGLETVAAGFDDRPVAIASPPGSDRLYVVDRTVGIFLYEDGAVSDEPILDLSDDLVTADREDGVMGLAFHPEFADNRRCFVTYTAQVREGTPDEYHNTGVLAEFEVGSGGRDIDRVSERTVLEVPSPNRWHNVTNVAFGPDGYLYVGIGDGGGTGDQDSGHVDDWYDAVAGGNGQDVTENLLGSIVRIDVDARPTEHHRSDPDAPDEPSELRGYAIPRDNPLVGGPGYDELYAWGIRSPWGIHFDGEDFFVADVGQGRREEVNRVEKGGNYGWNVKEGTRCFQSSTCPDRTPAAVRGGEPLRDPIIEYSRELGICVIGGLVYGGDALPGLRGHYVFADLVYQGRLFVAIPPGDDEEDDRWDFTALSIRDDDAEKVGQVLAFAEDGDGELLVMANAGADGNSVQRVVPAE